MANKLGRELGINEQPMASQRFHMLTCKNCGKKRWLKIHVLNPTGLCLKCCNKMNNKGSRCHLWRGGVMHAGGYILVRVDEDSPYARMRTKAGYIREHRFVMAKHIGRPLEKWEVVHHINGDKGDNRIENLELLEEKKYHLLDKNLKGQLGLLAKRVTILEAENVMLKERVKELEAIKCLF